MENKDIFLKQIASFQNFRSMLETRNTLLEKALGEDTTVMDFRGIDEFENCLADLLYVMFTPFGKITYESAQEEMDWFIYEWDSEGANQIEIKGKVYTITSPEDFWNYLVDVYE